jgi:CRISPR-associated protein Cas6
MFWQENDDRHKGYQVPEDVFDLVFRLRGSNLDIDHAFALSRALQSHLTTETCARIGVHGVRMAGSGNGWNRPEQGDATLPLSRRARLAIRVHCDDADEVARITNQILEIGEHEVSVGESVKRSLSTFGTLHARAVCCERDQSEADFLAEVADCLRQMGIKVTKMICGKSTDIRTDTEALFTRSLMVADLEPEESVNLQQTGLGDGRLLGCGLFIPHKGIAPVFSIQQQ